MGNPTYQRFISALAEGHSQEEATRIANSFQQPGSAPIAPIAAANESALTDDELREAIKAATGKAPHWKVSRDKLVAQYAALGKD